MTLKERFIEALQNGNYMQCDHMLKDPSYSNCFCAGGLLCEIYNNKEWEYNNGLLRYNYEGRYFYNYPPLELCEMVGITSTELVRWNDEEKISFKEIANRLMSKA
jgi:hypothetical protein